MEYYLVVKKKKKEGNFTFCNSMGGSGEYYAKRKKPVRERQVPYDFTYLWNVMNKISQQSRDRLMDTENTQLSEVGGGVEGGQRRLTGMTKVKKKKRLMGTNNSVVITRGKR